MSCMAHGKKLCDNGWQERYVAAGDNGGRIEKVRCPICHGASRDSTPEQSKKPAQTQMFDGRKDAYSE